MSEWGDFIAQEEGWQRDNPVRWLSSFRFMFRWYRGRWVADLLNGCMEVMMSRGKGTQKTAVKNASAYGTEFVNFTMPAAELGNMQARYSDAATLWEDLQTTLAAGYRVSFSYSQERTAFITSLTCRAEGMPNDGCTMTSFAGDWTTSLSVALYKHIVLLQEDWSSVRGRGSGLAFG